MAGGTHERFLENLSGQMVSEYYYFSWGLAENQGRLTKKLRLRAVPNRLMQPHRFSPLLSLDFL